MSVVVHVAIIGAAEGHPLKGIWEGHVLAKPEQSALGPQRTVPPVNSPREVLLSKTSVSGRVVHQTTDWQP